MASSGPIKPLPTEVVAQIKSSISITSLNGVILELLKNSLDAGATKINIQVHRSQGTCIVEDNGLGIHPAEFEARGAGLAKLHHTSKRDSVIPQYGVNGCFLASLSALSLLNITSKHIDHHWQYSLTLFRGVVTARFRPAPPARCINPAFKSGTRVNVHNLFGDMPVRVKQRALESMSSSSSLKEWDHLRKDIASLLLCFPYIVEVFLKDAESRPNPRKVRITLGRDDVRPFTKYAGQPQIKIGSVLYQAGFIPTPSILSWMQVTGSTSSFWLCGGISLDPAPTKNIQFISIGIDPVPNDEGHNILYEHINRLFANSLFGVVDDLPELDEREKRRRAEDKRFKSDGFTNKELKGTGKGVDRWPMFCFQIDFVDEADTRHKRRSPDDVFEDDHTLASITNLIQQVVVEFLKANNLMPKHVPNQQSPRKRDRLGNLVNCNDSQRQPMAEGGTPKTKLSTTPAINSKSSSQMDNISYPTRDTACAPVSRTDSPFDIWPRVKSGRTIHAPAVPKPFTLLPPIEQPSLPSRYRHLKPRPPTKEDGSVSSHFSKADAVVSKEGQVVRVPFLDVGASRTPRRRNSASRTIMSKAPMSWPPESTADLALYDNRRVITESSETYFAPPSSGALFESPRSRSAPRLDLPSTSTSSLLVNDSVNPRGRSLEATPLPSLRQSSWEDAYRKELYSPPRKSRSPCKNKQEKDEVIRYTDSTGKETILNMRTGQTMMPPKKSTNALPSSADTDRAEGRVEGTARLSTRLLPRATKSAKSAVLAGEPRPPSPFVASVLQGYTNPAFRPINELAIPQINNSSTADADTHAILHGQKHNCTHVDIEKAFKTGAGGQGEIGRLSKQGLKNVRVIGQVDKKFILIVMRERDGEVIVLVDQHAADERIRIETLMEEYFQPPHPSVVFQGHGYPTGGLTPGVRVEVLSKQVNFEVDKVEAAKFGERQAWFARWGVVYRVGRIEWMGVRRHRVLVMALSPGIAARCGAEPKLVIDLMRREVYSTSPLASSLADIDTATATLTDSEVGMGTGIAGDWLKRLHGCPPGILELLNSRACRSAIMFNDELSKGECEVLIQKLGETRFPFMCAHGRPSMVPLVEVGGGMGVGSDGGGYEEEGGIEWGGLGCGKGV